MRNNTIPPNYWPHKLYNPISINSSHINAIKAWGNLKKHGFILCEENGALIRNEVEFGLLMKSKSLNLIPSNDNQILNHLSKLLENKIYIAKINDVHGISPNSLIKFLHPNFNILLNPEIKTQFETMYNVHKNNLNEKTKLDFESNDSKSEILMNFFKLFLNHIHTLNQLKAIHYAFHCQTSDIPYLLETLSKDSIIIIDICKSLAPIESKVTMIKIIEQRLSEFSKI